MSVDNAKSDIMDFFDNASWLNEEIDELMEIKTQIEANSDHKFYVVAEIIINCTITLISLS